MRGVYLAYALVAYCYFTVAIVGYWAFGNDVQDNVLLSIKHPKWVVGLADIFVVIHVFGSYQVRPLASLIPPLLGCFMLAPLADTNKILLC